MRSLLSAFLFLACASLSLLSAFFAGLGWLWEKLGKLFHALSWRLDVIANIMDEWNGTEE